MTPFTEEKGKQYVAITNDPDNGKLLNILNKYTPLDMVYNFIYEDGSIRKELSDAMKEWDKAKDRAIYDDKE